MNSLRWARGLAILSAQAILVCAPCSADESDQYLSWDVELADSAPALNAFINARMTDTLDLINRDNPDCECETLTKGVLADIYFNRIDAKLIRFIEASGTIDIHPPREITNGEFMDLSIYRTAPVTLTIRVTRTIRIGEVYLGTDKLNHFFGIGRRYYSVYRSALRARQSEAEAVDAAIRWGLLTENTVLGTTTNGIFSFADLEANFQGFQLAKNLCAGETPHLRHDGKRWTVVRPLDLRDYIHPAFDESFNPPYYTGGLRVTVINAIKKDYAPRAHRPEVLHRFTAYRAQMKPPNRSTLLTQQYLREHNVPSQRPELLSALGLAEGDAVAPMNPYSLTFDYSETAKH